MGPGKPVVSKVPLHHRDGNKKLNITRIWKGSVHESRLSDAHVCLQNLSGSLKQLSVFYEKNKEKSSSSLSFTTFLYFIWTWALWPHPKGEPNPCKHRTVKKHPAFHRMTLVMVSMMSRMCYVSHESNLKCLSLGTRSLRQEVSGTHSEDWMRTRKKWDEKRYISMTNTHLELHHAPFGIAPEFAKHQVSNLYNGQTGTQNSK